MAGTTNPHKAAAQTRRAIALSEAANRLLDALGGDQLDRQAHLSDLIAALEGRLSTVGRSLEEAEAVQHLQTSAWDGLACMAEIRTPDEDSETRTIAIELMRRNLVLCSAATRPDPFRGLSVVA